jgi:transposase
MAEYLDAAPNTVYWWVRRAREEGWLTKGQQGRAGANAGPRLIMWLKEQEEER